MPATLMLHTVVASTIVYAACWCVYAAKLRLLFTCDPYFRSWNDTKQALQDAGQCWAVLLAMLVINLPSEPWEGHGMVAKTQTRNRRSTKALPVDGDMWGRIPPQSQQGSRRCASLDQGPHNKCSPRGNGRCGPSKGEHVALKNGSAMWIVLSRSFLNGMPD